VFAALAVMNLTMPIGGLIIVDESLVEDPHGIGGLQAPKAEARDVLRNRRYGECSITIACATSAMFG